VSWKSSSAKKQRPNGAQLAALRRLEQVRSQRRPFRELSRRLVAGTLERFAPPAGTIVEIGMGDGQLRERLPEPLLSRVVHTEPDAAVSRSYRKQYPRTEVLQASASRLPFETGSVAAVVGLCVLDVVKDGLAVADELARVLRPGGRVFHWLDMSTVFDDVVESLWSVGLVPFPNVFRDPSTGAWPEDLWLFSHQQVALVLSALVSGGSPAARPLAEYLAVFSKPPLAPGAATRELLQLQESAELRQALHHTFRAAYELAPSGIRAELAQVAGQPLSTAQHFQSKLQGWFTADAGFEIEVCAIQRAWEATPQEDPALLYRSCLVGELRHLSHRPETLLCADAASPLPDQELVELGILTFVATRRG
jgi:ubiquinone/menaquinone biosynthesis C-methylase UbiE